MKTACRTGPGRIESGPSAARKFLPVLFSVFFVFIALAEAAYPCEQCCDSPCTAVCLGGASCLSCDDSASERIAGPEETGNRMALDPASLPAARTPADEIFHPPLL